METVFTPRTRKEIKCCDWFSVDHLPVHKADANCKSSLGFNPNSFFMIMPFVKKLKKWVNLQQFQLDEVSSLQNYLSTNKGKKNATGSMTGNSNSSKKRQRHKSTGDLDGLKLSQVSTALNTFQSNHTNTNSVSSKKQNIKRQLFNSKSPSQLLDAKVEPIRTEEKIKKNVTNLIDFINGDPNIAKWKHFTFAIDSILNVV